MNHISSTDLSVHKNSFFLFYSVTQNATHYVAFFYIHAYFICTWAGSG